MLWVTCLQGFGTTGLVDMWVTPVDWAIEFLRNGDDLLKHEQRFEPGGKYYCMPASAYAVVDFRLPVPGADAHPSRPLARPHADCTYFVEFSPDFSTATMRRATDLRIEWGSEKLLG